MVGIEKLEGRTRGICVQNVLADCFLSMLDRSVGYGDDECPKDKRMLEKQVRTFGFEESRSAAEITTETPLVAAAGVEWRYDHHE